MTGEGLAILMLERLDGVEPYERRRRAVEFTTTFRAVFVRYLQGGLPDREANQRRLPAWRSGTIALPHNVHETASLVAFE